MRMSSRLVAGLLLSASCVARYGWADELYWYYQFAGAQTLSTSLPTAVAMGDGKAWPVVFVPTTPTSIQPVTLGAFRNTSTNTYWHSLGQPVQLPGQLSVTPGSLMVARDGSTGSVGVFVDPTPSTTTDITVAAVGQRQTGMTSSLAGGLGLVRRLDGSLEMVPSSGFPPSTPATSTTSPVRSVATTPWGSLGVLAGTTPTYHEHTTQWGWQNSDPLSRSSVSFAELAYDGAGRPVIAHSFAAAGASVSATTFDTRSGTWQTQAIGVGSSTLEFTPMPTVATDSKGGVGVAWTSYTNQINTLMYAYKPLGQDWKTHVVTTQVSVPLTVGGALTTEPIAPQYRVGLAFDADDLPVISFTGVSRRVYIAYDPVFQPEAVNDTRLAVDAGQTTLDNSFVNGPVRFVKEGGGTLIRDGAATNTHGTFVAEGTLVVRNPTAISTGPLGIAAGAAVVVDAGPALAQATLSIAELNLQAGSRLDIGHGRVVIAAGGMSEQGLRAAILDGRDAGDWRGESGIVSSQVASSAAGTRAVGYAVAQDGSATVAYSAPGDTNLDGLVDLVDLLGILASGTYEQAAAASWSQGDFNYDGSSDLLDLLSVLGSGTYDAGSYLGSATPAAGAVAVPEPGSLALFVSLAAGFGLYGRRPFRRHNRLKP